MTHSIKESIQNADGKNVIKEHAKDKFPSNYNFVDKRAKNMFRKKKVTVSIISCSY